MIQFQSSARLTPIEHVIAGAVVQLEERGYSTRSRHYYEQGWNLLIRFAAQSAQLSAQVRDLEPDFLANCGIAPDSKRRDLSWSQDVIRRGLRILVEIQETGEFRCHERRTEDPCIPLSLQQVRERYETFCSHDLRHRASTITHRRWVLQGFLVFLAARGIVSLAKLKPTLLNAFAYERAQQIGVRTLATEVGCLRSFLRFLCMEGIVATEILAHARTLGFSREHRLPPVWPPDAVEALLGAVDRTLNVGKRNYAILLLAARLGLRACDIRALELENIKWAEDRLTLTQSKTGSPLSLPLGEEVGQALIDYLRHARPHSHHRQVFLKARAPHEPFGRTNPFHSVISSTMRRADITLPAGMPRGLHSLRHTLATALVNAGQPLESVAAVLGHRSIESTRIYTHLDRSALSSVALDPEEVLHD